MVISPLGTSSAMRFSHRCHCRSRKRCQVFIFCPGRSGSAPAPLTGPPPLVFVQMLASPVHLSARRRRQRTRDASVLGSARARLRGSDSKSIRVGVFRLHSFCYNDAAGTWAFSPFFFLHIVMRAEAERIPFPLTKDAEWEMMQHGRFPEFISGLKIEQECPSE